MSRVFSGSPIKPNHTTAAGAAGNCAEIATKLPLTESAVVRKVHHMANGNTNFVSY
jgi:hypothetical protein